MHRILNPETPLDFRVSPSLNWRDVQCGDHPAGGGFHAESSPNGSSQPAPHKTSTLSSHQISRWSKHEELRTLQVSWDFRVVSLGLVRYSRCTISATLRGRWFMSAAPTGAFPPAPCPSFWPSTSTLRRQIRGSWLAGGFQRAVKLVFTLTSDFSLAFGSRFVPSGIECVRFVRVYTFNGRAGGRQSALRSVRSPSVSTSSVSCHSAVWCASSCCSHSRGDSQGCVWLGFPWLSVSLCFPSGFSGWLCSPLFHCHR